MVASVVIFGCGAGGSACRSLLWGICGGGWLAFFAEEVAHEGGALVGEDAGGDGRFGVEGGVVVRPVGWGCWCGWGNVGGVTAFGVGGAVDYSAELAPSYCSSAH